MNAATTGSQGIVLVAATVLDGCGDGEWCPRVRATRKVQYAPADISSRVTGESLDPRQQRRPEAGRIRLGVKVTHLAAAHLENPARCTTERRDGPARPTNPRTSRTASSIPGTKASRPHVHSTYCPGEIAHHERVMVDQHHAVAERTNGVSLALEMLVHASGIERVRAESDGDHESTLTS
jgi:hypothetical protein